MSKIRNIELLDWLRLCGISVRRSDNESAYYAEEGLFVQPKEQFLNNIRAAIHTDLREKRRVK